RPPVHTQRRDPSHYPARVLHPDRVPCRVIPEGDLVRWPRARDARIEMERRAAQPEPEDRLDRGAVHPPGRPRVPGPSPAPHVRWLGLDVGGDHVRPDLVPRDARPPARAGRAGLAAPESTAHDCAIESIRHSALLAEPSGVPSSKEARRYQSPTQASHYTTAWSECECWRNIAPRSC